MLSVCSFRVYEKKLRIRCFYMNSSEEYCALLLLAEEEEEAEISKKDRCIFVQQHFEMRPVLVELYTRFQNLMNYFSHPFSLKTRKLSDCMSLFIIILVKTSFIHYNLYTRQLFSKSNQATPRNLTCDLDGIVVSKLNPLRTHPGPTKFGEDRHLNTWEEYGDKQANKQTNRRFLN